MIRSPARRSLLRAVATLPLVVMLPACAARRGKEDSAEFRLAALEKAHGGRLGVCAIDATGSVRIRYRADERFPLCSTFKAMLAGAVLARDGGAGKLLQERIRYAQGDLVSYSPLTERHIDDGMTVADLCAAAIRYSDNTAANLLMKRLGGPAAVTAFARSIGDREFRVDRWETELNSAIPGDPRDTTTPLAMAGSLRSLALGNALPDLGREQLCNWLLGNTTGAKRIRTGVPSDWQVGDKTGSGAYGTTNDVAVLWPPKREPLVLAIYYTQQENAAKSKEEVIAAAARIAVDA